MELEVADSFRDQVQRQLVREWNPGSGVDEFVVDVRPLRVGRTRIGRLEWLPRFEPEDPSTASEAKPVPVVA